jgi:hypothetical protein
VLGCTCGTHMALVGAVPPFGHMQYEAPGGLQLQQFVSSLSYLVCMLLEVHERCSKFLPSSSMQWYW